MGLMDSIRKAEEQGRRTLDRAREGLEDAERRLRRKMRIYPLKRAAALRRTKTKMIDPEVTARLVPGAAEELHDGQDRPPIVSVGSKPGAA